LVPIRKNDIAVTRHARTRSRTGSVIPYPGWVRRWYTNGILTTTQQFAGQSSPKYWEDCSDYVGGQPPWPDSNLTISKRGWETVSTLNGVATYFKSGSNERIDTYSGWAPSNTSHYVNAGFVPPAIDWTYWRTKALANLNPNRPVVDLPVSIAELKDIPKMLKNLGDLLRLGKSGMAKDVVKTMAEGHLNWQFGWAPLINDLSQLLGFTDMVNDRLDYLKKLDGGTDVARRLGRLPEVSQTNRILWGNDGHGKLFYEFYQTSHALDEGWYKARVALNTPLPPTDREQRELARNAALGLNVSPSTAWNLIPWSWLIDWFANTGDLLSLTQNAIPYRVWNLNVMVKTTCRSTVVPTYLAPGLSSSGGKGYYIVKRRDVTANPKPWITFKPWITQGQFAILGSLATVRALR